MSQIKTASPIQLIASFLLLGVFIWLFWVLGSTLWIAFKALAEKSPTVAAPLATGALTVLGAVLAVVVGRYFERKKEAEIAQRQKRIDVFESAAKLFLDLMLSSTDEENKERNFVAELRAMTPRIILWAKPHSLIAYKALVIGVRSDATSLTGKLHSLEDFLLALRKDLELKNNGLNRGDILRLFITDYDSLITK